MSEPVPRDGGTGRGGKRRLLIVVALMACVGLWTLGRLWWRSAHLIETDNAYVSAHIHPVSSRIAGIVERVLVEDHQYVRRGQTLVELDPVDQTLKIEQLQAEIRISERQLAENAAQTSQAEAQESSAVAQIAQSEAQLRRAREDAERMNRLYDGQLRLVSRSQVDAANADYAVATADLRARREGGLRAAQAQVEASRSAREVILSRIDSLNVQLKELRQQLAYTRILAPASGRVGGRTVEVGARVQAGQQFAAIVQKDVWVTANFKETQLSRLRPGMAAKVKVDGIPDLVLDGSVQSLSPATGAQFSLLPPDNATGNFTRIVQRVPIRIALKPEQIAPYADRLLPGMSAVVEIDDPR